MSTLGSTSINRCPTLIGVTPLAGPPAEPAFECVPQDLGERVVEAQPDFDAAGLATVFKALGSPARLRLLAVIQASAAGEACVCELVEEAGVAQSTVSHHLAVLVSSGLLRRERRGTWAWYTLVPERLATVRELLSRSDAQVS